MFKMHFSETLPAPLGCLFYQNNKDSEREDFKVWNFNDWPVGESLSLLAALSGEADGDLFLPWVPLGTFKVCLFDSSGEAGLDFMQHKTHGQQLTAQLEHLFIISRHSDQSPPPRHHLHPLPPRYRWRRVYRQPREQPKIPGRRLVLSGPGLEENLEDQYNFFYYQRHTQWSQCVLVKHEHVFVYWLNKTHQKKT